MNRSDILWRDGADSYSDSVRLPAGEAGEAEAAGKAFGERVRALASECFPNLKGYEIEFKAVAPGETAGKIGLRDFQASFRTSAGQDKSYGADGQLHACSTLAFDAEARIPSLGRAEETYGWVAGACALAGAAVLGALFFLLCRLALNILGAIVVPHVVIIGVLVIGAGAGLKAGHVIGSFVARLMSRRTTRDESVVAAAEDWDAFVTGAGRLLGNLKSDGR